MGNRSASAGESVQLNENSIPCAACGHRIPHTPGEVDWCDACEWNLDPVQDQMAESTYLKIYRKLGKQISRNLYESLIEKKPRAPRISMAQLLAFGVAGFIHAVTASLLILEAVILAKFWWFWALALSVPILMLFWILLPKPGSVRKLKIVPRQQAPHLYSLIDQISDVMKARRPDGIVIDGKPYASYCEYSIFKWKKKVITIGLPLFDNLNSEEIVSILCHEVSHGANGDIVRSRLVESAIEALDRWHFVLTPNSFVEGLGRGRAKHSMIIMTGNLIGFMLGLFPRLGCFVLARLLLQQSQECEYLADRLASEVCGTKEMISALERVIGDSPIDVAVGRAALSDGKIEVFSELKKLSSQKKSEREMERIRRLEIRNGLSFDATHPPTPYRIEFIRSYGSVPAKVSLSESESALIRAELDSFKTEVGTALINDYMASLSQVG